MDLLNGEVALLWVAVSLYAASTVLLNWTAVTRRNGVCLRWGVRVATLGLLPHGAAIVLRWVEVGHPPYIAFYEVASSDTWIAVALYALTARRYPRLRLTGMAVMPVSLLLIGAAVLSPREGRELLPILRGFWLVMHVLFAKLAYGPYLLGFGAATLHLWARVGPRMAAGSLPRPSDAAVFDELSYRFVGFGFLMHGVMVIAGAIWANQAWGRYWSWDPIETWSLVSWLTFAVVLHLRVVHGWRELRAAYATVGAVALVLFAFFAVPLIGGSHQALIGT